MDIEKTIQFLVETAAQHDARLAEIEKGNQVLQQAVLALVQNQASLQAAIEESRKSAEETRKSVEETRKSLRVLDEKTDQRIAALVTAVAKLVELRTS